MRPFEGPADVRISLDKDVQHVGRGRKITQAQHHTYFAEVPAGEETDRGRARRMSACALIQSGRRVRKRTSLSIPAIHAHNFTSPPPRSRPRGAVWGPSKDLSATFIRPPCADFSVQQGHHECSLLNASARRRSVEYAIVRSGAVQFNF